MKVVLKQREDNKDIVDIVFYNNTPDLAFLASGKIGLEGVVTSIPTGMLPSMVQESRWAVELLTTVMPGQTFTSSFSLRDNFKPESIPNLNLTYCMYHPLYNDGVIYLLKSKTLQVEV